MAKPGKDKVNGASGFSKNDDIRNKENPSSDVINEEAADPVGSAASQEEAKTIEQQAEEVLENFEKSNDELAQAQALAADWQDKYLRLHAEWDTYRRRTEERRKIDKELAAEKIVKELIPVIDDFERTIAYAQSNGETGLLGGVEAVYNKFVDALVKQGVTIVNPEGEEFNALEHQAVAMVEDSEAFEETVAQVYQKGYKLGDKVIRNAMVTVTSGGPKRPKPEE